jgi:hypothetical protein
MLTHAEPFIGDELVVFALLTRHGVRWRSIPRLHRHRDELLLQAEIDSHLVGIAELMKTLKKSKRRERLRTELAKVTWPERFGLVRMPRRSNRPH